MNYHNQRFDAFQGPVPGEITRRGYLLWVAAGCPPGREQEFWAMAERELLATRQEAAKAILRTSNAGRTRLRGMILSRGMGAHALGTTHTPALPDASATLIRRGVKLASFHDVAAAVSLVALLNEQGIEASLCDGREVGGFWFFAYPREGVYVRVAPESFVRAVECLESDHDSRAMSKLAIHCPHCGSLRLDYQAAARQTWWEAFCGFALVLAGILPHEFRCQDCQGRWR